MSSVRLDLRRLEPGSAPRPQDVAPVQDAGSVRLRGPVPARGPGRWLDDEAFVGELEDRPAYGRRLD